MKLFVLVTIATVFMIALLIAAAINREREQADARRYSAVCNAIKTSLATHTMLAAQPTHAENPYTKTALDASTLVLRQLDTQFCPAP